VNGTSPNPRLTPQDSGLVSPDGKKRIRISPSDDNNELVSVFVWRGNKTSGVWNYYATMSKTYARMMWKELIRQGYATLKFN
jgi:hypothetical protein